MLLSHSTPQFPSRSHVRTPSRPPTRHRIMDDILADLSPTTTFEAFTSTSGKLRASIEFASPTQRAFGIRAAIASKKIQEWLAELSAWPWPAGGSEGFLTPVAIRKASETLQGTSGENQVDIFTETVEFWGSIPAEDVMRYESRIDNIWEDMEDLNVEEIKRQVMESHILPISRPSTPHNRDNYVPSSPTPLQYTRMDDLTTAVTATVLKALPNLTRLNALMNVWSIRLAVLRQVSPLMLALKDAEAALMSGWNAINLSFLQTERKTTLDIAEEIITRQDFEVMRNALQDKVTILGQQLDHILDALEGQEDTIPEAWLDRMEAIEQEYGEWAVCGDRRVREGEWTIKVARRLQEQNPKLPEVSYGLPKTAARVSKNLEPERKSFPLEAGEVYLMDRHSCNETREVGNQRTHDLCGLAIDSTLIEGPNKTGFCLGKIVGGEPSLQEPQQNSDQINGQIPVTMETSGLGIKDRDGDIQSDESSFSLQPSIKDFGSHIDDTVENPCSTTKIDLMSGVLSGSESVAAGSGGDLDVALPGEKESKDPVLISAQSLPNLDTEQSFLPPKPRSPGALSFDGSREVDKVSEPQEIFLLSHGDSLESSTASQNVNEWHRIAHQEKLDQPVLSAFNGDQQGVIYDREMADFVPRFEDQVEDDVDLEFSRSSTSSNGLHDDVINTRLVPTSMRAANGVMGPTIPVVSRPNFTTPEVSDDDEAHSTLRTPSFSSESSVIHAIISPSNRPRSGCYLDDGGTPRSPSKVQQLSLDFANALKQIRPLNQSNLDGGASISNDCSRLDVSNVTQPCSLASVSECCLIERGSAIQSALQVSNPILEIASGPENASVDGYEIVEAIDMGEPQNSEENLAPQCTSESPTASHKECLSSDASTITKGQIPEAGIHHVSPLASAQVPQSPVTADDSTCLENIDEESPSFGRVRIYDDVGDYSIPSSPSPITAVSKRYQSQPISSSPPNMNAISSENPATPGELPFFPDLEVSPAPISSPSKVSADQLQQQISEILDSIPTRIRLTSEPDSDQRSDITQPKKRSSLGAGFRPMSRASTPSFTLAPAYAKNPRPRAQNGHPEIKLYHLSRGTGEAPIKLFVRLVGEHGERVMVRVGGGWADLGEYLREYASHHGRKSDKTGKVEIQDFPSRVVSVGSTYSASTLRNGAGKSSPVSRPSSSLDRPLSSLAVRKTRKSLGENTLGCERSPSTPQSSVLRNSPSISRQSETPSSVTSRPVSRHSWTEEDSPLGLAGPTSKKVDISAESAAWVESMKEKVRMASAEKKEKTVPTATDFGQLGKVGGTKRLFKKKGSM